LVDAPVNKRKKGDQEAGLKFKPNAHGPRKQNVLKKGEQQVAGTGHLGG